MTGFSWEYPLTTTEKVRRVFQCYERELQFAEDSRRALREKGHQQELHIDALRKACSRVAIPHAENNANSFETPQQVYIGDDDACSGLCEVETPTASTQCGSEVAPTDTAMELLFLRPNSDDGTPSSRKACAALEGPQTVYFAAFDAGDGDDDSEDLEESYHALDYRPKSRRGIRIPVVASLVFLLFLLVLWWAFGAKVGIGNPLGGAGNHARMQQADQHRVPLLLEEEHSDVSPADLNAYGLTMAHQYHQLDEAHLALLQALTKDTTKPVYYNNLAYILLLKSDSGGEKSAEERQQAGMLLHRAIDLIWAAHEEMQPIPPSLAVVVQWNANAVLDRGSGEWPRKAPAPFLE